jgi:hypothetical protein
MFPDWDAPTAHQVAMAEQQAEFDAQDAASDGYWHVDITDAATGKEVLITDYSPDTYNHYRRAGMSKLAVMQEDAAVIVGRAGRKANSALFGCLFNLFFYGFFFVLAACYLIARSPYIQEFLYGR